MMKLSTTCMYRNAKQKPDTTSLGLLLQSDKRKVTMMMLAVVTYSQLQKNMSICIYVYILYTYIHLPAYPFTYFPVHCCNAGSEVWYWESHSVSQPATLTRSLTLSHTKPAACRLRPPVKLFRTLTRSFVTEADSGEDEVTCDLFPPRSPFPSPPLNSTPLHSGGPCGSGTKRTTGCNNEGARVLVCPTVNGGDYTFLKKCPISKKHNPCTGSSCVCGCVCLSVCLFSLRGNRCRAAVIKWQSEAGEPERASPTRR